MRVYREPGTLEHIVPASLGGKDNWENLIGACQRCNSERSAEPLLWYLVQRYNEGTLFQEEVIR